MIKKNTSQKIVLAIGDFLFFYASLFMALFFRYLSFPHFETIKNNFFYFSIIYIFWILIFFIAGFYDIEKKISWSIIGIAKVLIIGAFLAVVFFYLFPKLGITPKTILALNTVFASFLIWAWRTLFFTFSKKIEKIKIAAIGDSKEKEELIKYIRRSPYLGYEFVKETKDANIILASAEIKDKPEIIKFLYNSILEGKTIFSFENFYENITGKVPVSLIGEEWFLQNLVEINKQPMENFKRVMDIILTIIFFIPLVILFLPVAVAIKINSPGPIFYRQKRVGKNGKIFEIIKFRSMRDEPESEKEKWQKPNGRNKRITAVGNFLRKTRIDELPQLWNVLKGDLSLIGPRPERPEIVEELKKIVPHYSMRHIIRPGLTGWAQIHFGDASAEDAMEKLQYDLFYIKNRSLALDTAIFLKTIMVVLQTSGK